MGWDRVSGNGGGMKLNYRGEALSGQIEVRKGRRKCSGLIRRHRVD